MLWLRYGLVRGKSMRRVAYDYLESPGTKTFTQAEARSMMNGFEDIQMQPVFSPGDLLLHQPSARFQSKLYRIAWKLYPRALARTFFRRWALFLLISARKAHPTVDLGSD